MGCHALLQGIFLTQGLNLGVLNCRQILYQLSHQGSLVFCSLWGRKELDMTEQLNNNNLMWGTILSTSLC